MSDRIAKAEAAVAKAKERLTLADARAATAVIRMREAEEAVWRAENRLRSLLDKTAALPETNAQE